MKHTAESIKRLIGSNPKALERALRTVMSVNGYCWGGHDFAKSLLERLDGGRALTEAQADKARDMLNTYAVVLANVANDKAQAQQPQPQPQPRKQPARKPVTVPADDGDGETLARPEIDW